MTTLAQLDRLAAKEFHDQMRRRGFAIERQLTFWRKRGPLFDVLWSEILSSGVNLRVSATVWSPWIESTKGDLGSFPPRATLIGGTVSDEFPEKTHGGQLFSVGNESEAEYSFKTILGLIDERVIPWFQAVNSYETYVALVGTRGFHPAPEYRERIKRGIALGFEREPYP